MRQATKSRWQAKTLTAKEGGHTTDRQGPRVEEDEGWRGKRSSEVRAKILKNIVTICRNNEV
jgi:hypothetical protein